MKKLRGFAALTPERRREISRKGGLVGAGHKFSAGEEARDAAVKAGAAKKPVRQRNWQCRCRLPSPFHWADPSFEPTISWTSSGSGSKSNMTSPAATKARRKNGDALWVPWAHNK